MAVARWHDDHPEPAAVVPIDMDGPEVVNAVATIPSVPTRRRLYGSGSPKPEKADAVTLGR